MAPLYLTAYGTLYIPYTMLVTHGHTSSTYTSNQQAAGQNEGVMLRAVQIH